MNRFIFLTIIISLVCLPVTFSQVYWGNIDEHMEYLRRDRLVSDFNPEAYENIDGSPYLVKDYEKGKVYLESGEILEGEFRFDLYANAIQFINKGSRYVLAYPEKISMIELNGNILTYIDYKIDAGIDHGYFITLVKGYYSLYILKSKTLKDPEPTKPYQQARPARFLDHKDYYYIKIGENPAERVRNKKEIIKICGEKGKEVEMYIKEEKINVKNVDDLTKLVTYINKITSD
jgi:hypothetical protein